jgi:hypothetical protein
MFPPPRSPPANFPRALELFFYRLSQCSEPRSTLGANDGGVAIQRKSIADASSANVVAAPLCGVSSANAARRSSFIQEAISSAGARASADREHLPRPRRLCSARIGRGRITPTASSPEIDGRLRVRRRPRTGSSAPTGRLPRPLRKGTPWGAIPRGGGFGPRRVTIGAQPKAPMRQHLGEATMCLLDIRQRLAAQTSELACLIPMAGLVTLIPLCRGV